MSRVIVLELDEDDYRSVREAIAVRRRFVGGVPEGESGDKGAIIAEICRGWLEYHESWPRQGPTEEVSE